MIEGLKPYPKYKDSGLMWLGSIPAHWEALPIFAFTKLRNQRERPDLPLLSVYRDYGVILRDSREDNYNVKAQDLSAYKVVEPGNLVLNKMKTWQGSLGISAHAGIVSPAYIVCKVRSDINGRYLHQILRSRPYITRYNQLSFGVRVDQWDMRYEYFKRVSVFFPRPDEQAVIVRFLDHANRRIERYVRAKKKLIALLNEQKQAIIHRAVTRGLDRNVRLKPSGIPWLGEIPEHWELRRLKQISRILRGKFTHRPRNDPSLYDGPYPFIQTSAVARAEKFVTSYTQTLNKKGLAVSKLFPSGTLLMAIAANIGDVAVLNFNACFPDSVIGFIPFEKTSRDYMFLVLRSMKRELLREAPVNTQGNLNVERVGAMPVPFPPLDEQISIVEFGEIQTAPQISAITRAEREIALIREYRTRLLADVATGQLDVRAAAAKLPDEPEELKPLDETEMSVESDEALNGPNLEEDTLEEHV